METLYPASWVSSSSFFVQENQSAEWTREENKKFEKALAVYDENTADRWQKVAAMIPGKSVCDVIKHYRELEEDVCEIEAGRVPIPGYNPASSFTMELMDGRNFDACRKKSSASRGSSDQERKKGIPWTEEEHKRFLMGLLKYGKGDWRNISRNFVISKTPTQVASHAQKYFIRQLSGGKDKRRPSIHDITTLNLTETASSENLNTTTCVTDQPSELPSPPKSFCKQKVLFGLSQSGELPVFDAAYSNLMFMSSPMETAHGAKRVSSLYSRVHFGAYAKTQNYMFQV